MEIWKFRFQESQSEDIFEYLSVSLRILTYLRLASMQGGEGLAIRGVYRGHQPKGRSGEGEPRPARRRRAGTSTAQCAISHYLTAAPQLGTLILFNYMFAQADQITVAV